MIRMSLVLGVLLVAAPVLAQTPYVGGTISADISRFSHAEVNGDRASSDGSEVLSGSLRAGTSIGSNWGVELEFVRAGRTNSTGPQIFPLAARGNPISSLITTVSNIRLPGGTAQFTNGAIPVDFRMDVSRRRSDLDTAAWVRQGVSSSVDLVYLAGLAFSRERSDVTETVTGRGIAAPTNFRSSSIDYGTHPLIGMEARIGLASKLRLVPGIRLQGLSDGWLLRPYVGLGWFF